MIYLASPYSHLDAAVRERRFQRTRRFVYEQLQLGSSVFSPIVYAHQFAEHFGAPFDAGAWKDHNDRWLAAASVIWVLQLDGWRESDGVTQEIADARKLGLPVIHRSLTA